MTIVSQIITDAYRESNNIAVGQIPSAEEQAEGLAIFNRLLLSVFGNEVGDGVATISVGNNNVSASYVRNIDTIPSSAYLTQSTRIVFNNQTAQTVLLNPDPRDGERLIIQDASSNFATYPVTIKGNGRTIDGATQVVLNTNGLKRQYFYRGDTNDWQSISPLALTDTFPFPAEFEDFFIIGVALRVNPRSGVSLDQQSIEAYKRLKRQFTARYSISNKQPSEYGLQLSTHNRGYPCYGVSPTQVFFRGF